MGGEPFDGVLVVTDSSEADYSWWWFHGSTSSRFSTSGCWPSSDRGNRSKAKHQRDGASKVPDGDLSYGAFVDGDDINTDSFKHVTETHKRRTG